jgi:hypothetical protein
LLVVVKKGNAVRISPAAAAAAGQTGDGLWIVISFLFDLIG